MSNGQFTWYEFFAGGGMARLGLGPQWRCLFSNDICDKKAAAYSAAFAKSGEVARELTVADVADLTPSDLPGAPDLVWGSFPCQDLSLAGNGAGLKGERSGTFAPFWRLIRRTIRDGRKPSLVVLENVVGAITSHEGKDFETIVRVIANEGYRVGALVIDAIRFVPQSRPRLFIVAVAHEVEIPAECEALEPHFAWHPRNLVAAQQQLPSQLRRNWIWWALPLPPVRTTRLSDLIELEPTGTSWHSPDQTRKLLAMMSPVNRKKVDTAKRLSMALARPIVGTVYRRTRPVGDRGSLRKTQRAEVRFDEVSGCLRTPAGGSSRQIILAVLGSDVRSRLISTREAARLMGVPEWYPIPANYNDAYHLFGDGVVVPVVSWLNEHLLISLASHHAMRGAA